MKQKGLADLSEHSKRELDEYKRRIEEARRKRMECHDAEVERDGIPNGSSSEEETEIYSPVFKDIYSKYKDMQTAPSDSE